MMAAFPKARICFRISSTPTIIRLSYRPCSIDGSCIDGTSSKEFREIKGWMVEGGLTILHWDWRRYQPLQLSNCREPNEWMHDWAVDRRPSEA
jgi:hypothetical protein